MTSVEAIADTIMTTPEVAQMIKHSEATLIYWRKVGTGPPYWRSGRRVFYSKPDVLRWLAEQQRATANSRGPRGLAG
jgi:DNA-binding transcriptional MerR regulator